MNNTTLMKIITTIFLFLVVSCHLDAAHLQYPSIESIQELIKKGGIFEASLKPFENKNILPGSVLFAKSAGPIPGYKDGIFLFVLKSNNTKFAYQKEDYHFEKLEILKNKQALLHIKIIGPTAANFKLPAMDVVVEGKKIDDSRFFFGYPGQPFSSPKLNKYFFLSGSRVYAKPVYIETRLREPVFATNPQSFILKDHGQVATISPLICTNPLRQFFIEHTSGFQEIPKEKSALLPDSILAADDHRRPARKHQIKQLLEYTIAKENGIKNMTFVAATGSGKTNTMLRLAELLRPKKVLIVTPRENLITQIVEESRLHYPHLRIAGSNESYQNIAPFLLENIGKNDITVVSLPGFQRSGYKNDEILSKIDIIIYDEAHHLFSPERVAMVKHVGSYKNNKIESLFFTATPDLMVPHKESGIYSVYELSGEEKPKFYNITPFAIFDAIKAKANVPFQIFNVIDLPPLGGTFKLDRDEYNEVQVDKLLADRNDHHSVVYDLYYQASFNNIGGTQSQTFGKFAMAFCAGIAHAEKLKDYLNQQLERPLPEDRQRMWDAHEARYKKSVRDYFLAQKKASESGEQIEEKIATFLREYPFVFADAVHSGNAAYPLSKQQAKDRLLRNRLGGSLFLAGANKMTEGYDNPRIEIIFNLNPVREANTRLIQRLGRLLRIFEENRQKIGILFEFNYDERQLLTSKVLGTMQYGLPGYSMRIRIERHVPGTAEYKLSYDLPEAKNQRGKKRALSSDEDSDERPAKKAKTADVKVELEKLVRELKEKLRILTSDAQNTTAKAKSAGMTMDMVSVETRPNHKKPRKRSTKKEEQNSSSAMISATDNSPEVIKALMKQAKDLYEQAASLFADTDLPNDLSKIQQQISLVENQIQSEPVQNISLGSQASNSSSSSTTSSTTLGVNFNANPPPIPKAVLPSSSSSTTTSTGGSTVSGTANSLKDGTLVLEEVIVGEYVLPDWYELKKFTLDRRYLQEYFNKYKLENDWDESVSEIKLNYSSMVRHGLIIAEQSKSNQYSGQVGELVKVLAKALLSEVKAKRIKVSVIRTENNPTEQFKAFLVKIHSVLNSLGFGKLESGKIKVKVLEERKLGKYECRVSHSVHNPSNALKIYLLNNKFDADASVVRINFSDIMRFYYEEHDSWKSLIWNIFISNFIERILSRVNKSLVSVSVIRTEEEWFDSFPQFVTVVESVLAKLSFQKQESGPNNSQHSPEPMILGAPFQFSTASTPTSTAPPTMGIPNSMMAFPGGNTMNWAGVGSGIAPLGIGNSAKTNLEVEEKINDDAIRQFLNLSGCLSSLSWAKALDVRQKVSEKHGHYYTIGTVYAVTSAHITYVKRLVNEMVSVYGKDPVIKLLDDLIQTPTLPTQRIFWQIRYELDAEDLAHDFLKLNNDFKLGDLEKYFMTKLGVNKGSYVYPGLDYPHTTAFSKFVEHVAEGLCKNIGMYGTLNSITAETTIASDKGNWPGLELLNSILAIMNLSGNKL